jgi:alkylated DNA repair dioxygenase AlkB
VLANFYRDGQQSVGSHTDRLGSLGPLPTIASVSLGAGRVFRLHPADSNVGAAAAAAAAGGAAGGGVSGSSSGGSSGRVVSSIDIHLPHNSLLIMWPPTQEQWKHEVSQLKANAAQSQ